MSTGRHKQERGVGLQPLDEINGYQVRPGFYNRDGATATTRGVSFTIHSFGATACYLLLFRPQEKEPYVTLKYPEAYHIGNTYSMFVFGLKIEEFEYAFQLDGPYDEKKGLLFKKENVLLDPYARAVTGQRNWGERPEGGADFIYHARVVENNFDWGDIRPTEHPFEDLVIYEMHVRGFTKDASSGVTPGAEGTYEGLRQKIPYLKDLGVNAVELMPAYEFMERSTVEPGKAMIRQKHHKDKVNYWGYLPGFYFAPKSAYCATKKPHKEFCDMVRAFHEAGIECIMEMYFPADTAPMKALYALWFWKKYYHVDGFHLLGDGVPGELIERDPFLYGVKKMFSDISGQPEKENMLAEYNRGFMQDMRRLLKSDEGMVAGAQFHIKRNTGNFGTINYMASQDGFTLYDTVTYNYRHNEANGEDNHDGSDYNYSWNCGVEGASRKQAIRRLREQQLRNAFLMLLLSQGTPMIYGGDEFGNSQNGNNNAWCQDNSVGWTDWKCMKKQEKLFSFVKKAIAFRKDHPILHMPNELRSVDYMAKGFPDVSFHGERAWFLNMENTSRLIGIMYCGAYAQKPDGTDDDFLYIGYNFHWEKRNIALPNLPDGMTWKKIADTSDQEEKNWFQEGKETYKKTIDINPRTIVVLVARQGEIENASVAALQDDNKA